MKVKEENEKASLKFNIQKTKIISWQIDGETVETMTDFIFSGFKSPQMVTAAMKLKDACSLEKKAMTDLDSVLKKQRHHFANKGPYRVGPSRRLSTEELMLSNCVVGEDPSESLGLQGDQTTQS